MRTTLTLDDSIADRLRDKAHESGKSFKEVVNETLRVGLSPGVRAKRSKPYRIQPVSLGNPLPGVDLTKARHLADELEDEEIVAKLRLRK